MNLNGKFPTPEMVEHIRKLYPNGCRVELVSLSDPYADLESGSKGTVDCVDSIGTIHINWDCGSGLGVVYGIDRIRKL